MKDYYRILELSFGSDSEAIKRAYRKLALKYHPDQNAGASAQEKFIEITEAYEMLRDDHKRKVYNAMYTSYFMNKARNVDSDPNMQNGAYQYAQSQTANQAYQYTRNKKGEGEGPFRHNSYSYTTTKKAHQYKTYKKPPQPKPMPTGANLHTKYWGIMLSMAVLTLAGLAAVLFTAASTKNEWIHDPQWILTQSMALYGGIFLLGVFFQYKGISLFMRYMYDYRRALKAPAERQA